MSTVEFDLDNLSPRDKRLARAAVDDVAERWRRVYLSSPGSGTLPGIASLRWPLPKTIPTVRQGPSGRWYRQAYLYRDALRIVSFDTRDGALRGTDNDDTSWWSSWPQIDAPTVAALILLPLTETVPE